MHGAFGRRIDGESHRHTLVSNPHRNGSQKHNMLSLLLSVNCDDVGHNVRGRRLSKTLLLSSHHEPFVEIFIRHTHTPTVRSVDSDATNSLVLWKYLERTVAKDRIMSYSATHPTSIAGA